MIAREDSFSYPYARRLALPAQKNLSTRVLVFSVPLNHRVRYAVTRHFESQNFAVLRFGENTLPHCWQVKFTGLSSLSVPCRKIWVMTLARPALIARSLRCRAAFRFRW
jgi:hypothetical protein